VQSTLSQATATSIKEIITHQPLDVSRESQDQCSERIVGFVVILGMIALIIGTAVAGFAEIAVAAGVGLIAVLLLLGYLLIYKARKLQLQEQKTASMETMDLYDIEQVGQDVGAVTIDVEKKQVKPYEEHASL